MDLFCHIFAMTTDFSRHSQKVCVANSPLRSCGDLYHLKALSGPSLNSLFYQEPPLSNLSGLFSRCFQTGIGQQRLLVFSYTSDDSGERNIAPNIFILTAVLGRRLQLSLLPPSGQTHRLSEGLVDWVFVEHLKKVRVNE